MSLDQVIELNLKKVLKSYQNSTVTVDITSTNKLTGITNFDVVTTTELFNATFKCSVSLNVVQQAEFNAITINVSYCDATPQGHISATQKFAQLLPVCQQAILDSFN